MIERLCALPRGADEDLELSPDLRLTDVLFETARTDGTTACLLFSPGDRVDHNFRRRPEAVLHLHHQTLGGLASDTGHLGQRSNVLVLNTQRKRLDIDSRQQRQRDFRPDARYFDQAPKQSALILRAEAV